MQNQRTIRAFTAGILLLVLTLGVMPRLYLHDLFANHSDLITQTNHSETGQVTANGYSCDVNDLVATSPFTEHNTVTELVSPVTYPSFNAQYTGRTGTTVPSFLSLRGPPSY